MAGPVNYQDRELRDRINNVRNPPPLKSDIELLRERIEETRRRNSGQGIDSLKPTALRPLAPITTSRNPSAGRPQRRSMGDMISGWMTEGSANLGPRRRSMGDVLNGWMTEGRRRIRDNAKPQQMPQDNSQYNRSLADFLAMAQQIVGQNAQGQLGLLGNQEAALKRNAAEIQGKIGGGYNALSSFIDGQAPVLQKSYQTGIEGVSDAATRAQSAISEGTAKAQAQQQAILSRLGNEDANIAIANTGKTLEDEMANRISDSAQRAQGAETQLNTNMATEVGYNTAMGTSAALEGQGQQDRVSRDLLSRLAELADQRQMIQSSSQQDSLGLAQNLMGSDYDIWQGNYNRRYQLDQDSMNNALKMAEMQDQGGAPELNATTWSAMGPGGQAQYALQQGGVPPDQAAGIMQAINETMGSGRYSGDMGISKFIQEIQRLAQERGLDPVSTQSAALMYYNYMQ